MFVIIKRACFSSCNKIYSPNLAPKLGILDSSKHPEQQQQVAKYSAQKDDKTVTLHVNNHNLTLVEEVKRKHSSIPLFVHLDVQR